MLFITIVLSISFAILANTYLVCRSKDRKRRQQAPPYEEARFKDVDGVSYFVYQSAVFYNVTAILAIAVGAIVWTLFMSMAFCTASRDIASPLLIKMPASICRMLSPQR
jgi:hypothetical protein